MTRIRVNLTEETVSLQPMPDQYRGLGGRSLTSRIVADEVVPTCHPLGPNNKIVLAPGLLGGASASSANRLSVGGKSPLTGGIKEANSGGVAALRLARLGIRAVVVEGRAKEPKLLFISRLGAQLRSAGYLWGKSLDETAALLQSEYGDRAGLVLIGPAGEMRLLSAAVAVIDGDGSPTRFAARGGLGAVLGAMGLKAIVIDDTGAPRPEPALPARYQAAFRAYSELLRTTPQTSEIYTRLSTPALVRTTNALGGLPTRNFQTGSFECADAISGETLLATMEARGGSANPTHACMPGCVIRCSNVYADAGGRVITGPVEYENVGLLGSNLGIGDLDQIAELNRICNQVGVDGIEVGAALGVAMEAGALPFGDFGEARRILASIASGDPLGRVIGSGAKVAGQVFGITRVPVVKGQAMPAYEPRAIKGMGVTFATSPMGADHTAGGTIRAQVDHHSKEGQVAASRSAQLAMPIYDALGVCVFAGTAVKAQLDVLAELLSSFTGRETTVEDLRALAQATLRCEHGFNRAAGFTVADDRLPEYFRIEVNPASGTVFDIEDEELDTLGVEAWT